MHTLMAVAAMYGADQRISEQFGVQYLAQRHFHMETRKIQPDIFRQQDAGSTSEPQPLPQKQYRVLW